MANRPLAAVVLSVAFRGGCATFVPSAPSSEAPVFQMRAQTKEDECVRASAVVLSAAESQETFGSELAGHGVQPIWLRIENREDIEYVFMLISLYPNYLSPAEAAWMSRGFGECSTEVKVQYFSGRHIPRVIAPATAAEGYVLVNLDPGVKAVAVDLIGDRTVRRFEFFQKVPGFEADFQRVGFDALYALLTNAPMEPFRDRSNGVRRGSP